MYLNYETMSSVLALFLSWLSITGSIYGLFIKLDVVLHKQKKEALTTWLQAKPFSASSSNWPNTFVSLFDDVFTKKHFTVKCFLRSILASIFSLGVILLIWWIVAPEQGKRLFSPYNLLQIFAISVFLNPLPDYLSLLESRWLIQWMTRSRSGALKLVMLVLDAVVTFFIFVLFSWVIIKLFRTEHVPDFQEYILFSLEGLAFKENIGVFVQTTFFTSVWVWLYAFSGFLLKLIAPLLSWLNIEEKPLHSMGSVLIVLISMGYLIAALIVLAGS